MRPPRRDYFSGKLLDRDSFELDQTYFRRSRGRGSVWLELDAGGGFEPWYEVLELGCSRRRDRHFMLDREAGVVRFGDGRQGRRPPVGAAVRGWYRHGGGVGGSAAERTLLAALAQVSHFSWMRQAARDKRGVVYEELDPAPTDHDRERATDALAELERLGVLRCLTDRRPT
jgi:hypothetical protein